MVAAALMTFAIGLLLMPVPAGGRFYSSLGDLCHTPLFICLTIGGLVLWEKAGPVGANRRRLSRRCFVVAVALFCFGVGMELMQHFAGRTAAVHDAIANGLGVIIGVCVFTIWNRQFLWPENQSIKNWLLAIAIAALVMAWWSPIEMLRDDWKLRSEFPNLVSFDSKIEISRWYFRDSTGELTSDGATDGDFAMKVTLPEDHSSVTLVELHSDWTKMQQLDFDLLLPADQNADQPNHQHADQNAHEIPIELSVLDRHHKNYDNDLFKKFVSLRRGVPMHVTLTRAEILAGPEDRALDLSAIQYFTVGLASRSAPVQIVIDAVKLTLQD
ncbi:MAG: hypothetical protein WBD20_09145 [Pirellulaceae bacterium]